MREEEYGNDVSACRIPSGPPPPTQLDCAGRHLPLWPVEFRSIISIDDVPFYLLSFTSTFNSFSFLSFFFLLIFIRFASLPHPLGPFFLHWFPIRRTEHSLSLVNDFFLPSFNFPFGLLRIASGNIVNEL